MIFVRRIDLLGFLRLIVFELSNRLCVLKESFFLDLLFVW